MLLIVLVVEKIIQHIVVTLAFYFDWWNISATVVVESRVLMVLGLGAALAFACALWAMVTQRKWASNLIIALALFDIVGEFVAQGTIGILITVSFLVAILLLVLAFFYRRQAARRIA